MRTYYLVKCLHCREVAEAGFNEPELRTLDKDDEHQGDPAPTVNIEYPYICPKCAKEVRGNGINSAEEG